VREEKALKPTPFSIQISDAKLADLRDRLNGANFAPEIGNANWNYGTNGDYLRELVNYWRTDYDWRKHERAMNAWPHFHVSVLGQPIHFLHAKGRGPKPLPLILSHGWPWTFWDFQKVLGPLTDPASHGGDPAESFDVVLPSLPGFVFSTPLSRTGINWWETADLWAALMREVLGYERFVAHGADWGSLITHQLGHKYADSVAAIHTVGAAPLAFWGSERPWSLDALSRYFEEGSALRAQAIAFEKRFASHVAVHQLDPQTLAFAMHDSPLGLCAWMLERRRTWSDCGGNVESRFSKDDLLNSISLYWLTESFGSSIRYYYEAAANPWRASHANTPVVGVPTGITLFAADSGPGSPDWTKEYFNRVYFRQRTAGGHFASAEEPEAIVEDIRATFRFLR